MAITSETSRQDFSCTGDANYDVNEYKIFSGDDIEVVHVSASGLETVLTSSFSVSNITTSGFRVTTTQSIATGTLVVRRNQAKKQDADWIYADDFSTPVLERQLDEMVMMIQELDEKIDRAVLQGATASATINLPAASANSIIGWNDGGTGLENKTPLDESLIDQAEAAQAAALAAQIAAQTAQGLSEAAQVVSQSAANAALSYVQAVYPVGSIYMNATTTANPNVILGFGTWTQWGSGRVPVGFATADTDFNTLEKTGGVKSHALTINELPAHSHAVSQQVYSGAGGGGSDSAGVTSTATGVIGSGQAHTNIQPYITVMMWKRTA